MSPGHRQKINKTNAHGRHFKFTHMKRLLYAAMVMILTRFAWRSAFVRRVFVCLYMSWKRFVNIKMETNTKMLQRRVFRKTQLFTAT